MRRGVAPLAHTGIPQSRGSHVICLKKEKFLSKLNKNTGFPAILFKPTTLQLRKYTVDDSPDLYEHSGAGLVGIGHQKQKI